MSTATFAAWISLMALSTSGGMQSLGMTGTTGTTTVIDTSPPFICNARMRTLIDRRPVLCRVARCAIQAKHTRVEDRISVATRTSCGQAGKLTRGMASLASQGGVGAGQREVRAVMIEVNMIPTGGVVAGRTVGAKFSIVIVILLMAGIAIHRRALELLIYMT